MEKRTIGLQGYFTRFLSLAAFSVVVLAVLFLFLFQALMLSGVVTPANAGETEARAEVERQKSVDTFTSNMISDSYDYIYFDTLGNVKSSSLTGARLDSATERYADPQASYTTGEYVFYPDGSYCLFFWQYAVRFTHPALQKVLPGAESLLLILFGICFIGFFLVFVRRVSRNFKQKLSFMEAASAQIAAQNLEAAVPTSVGIREFDHALQAMEDMRIALKASLAEQWQLEQQRTREITALAHDIKTPLTIINGNAELLLEEPLGEDQAKLVQSIFTAGMRARDYIRMLSQISSLDTAEETVEQLPVSDLLQQALLVLKPLADVKNMNIQVLSDKEQRPVWVYASSLTRALVNIGENAIRFSPHGGGMTIVTEQTDQTTTFCFQDEGVGFSKDALLHAREMLWQEDQSRSLEGNYGMGLAIVQAVAEKHGGKLKLKNTNRGACVTLSISNHNR